MVLPSGSYSISPRLSWAPSLLCFPLGSASGGTAAPWQEAGIFVPLCPCSPGHSAVGLHQRRQLLLGRSHLQDTLRPSANSRVTGGDAGASPAPEVSSPCPHSVRSLPQLSQPLHRCVPSHFSWHLDDTVFLAHFPLSLLEASFPHCLRVSLLHSTESCL